MFSAATVVNFWAAILTLFFPLSRRILRPSGELRRHWWPLGADVTEEQASVLVRM